MDRTESNTPAPLTPLIVPEGPPPALDREALVARVSEVITEVGKVVVGQRYMLERLLTGLFTNGHILLEGVPGLAKTLTISTLARVLMLDYRRLQFTPDLLPADLIGTMVYNQRESSFEVKTGPIFTNLVLADEINRSPAKVQSALLEAMQERQVTIGETTYPLDRPFLVLATQNPVEQEGTYPLPEAQVDRFMLKIYVDYPSKADELEVMRRMSDPSFDGRVRPLMSKSEIEAITRLVHQVTISDTLEQYIIELIFATRRPADYGLKELAAYVQFGASPRATISLHRAAKALAFLNGRDYVLPEDIKEMAPDVLNHRVLLNYEAEADGVTPRQVIDRILTTVSIGTR